MLNRILYQIETRYGPAVGSCAIIVMCFPVALIVSTIIAALL